MVNLDGVCFRVRTTEASSVVGPDTVLELRQDGTQVYGWYQGGRVIRGFLSGSVVGSSVQFTFAQHEADGHVHGGRSFCLVERLGDGRWRLTERYTWETRLGSGVNVFEQGNSRTAPPGRQPAEPKGRHGSVASNHGGAF